MIKRRTPRHVLPRPISLGFTLVELLVVITLVLIMMTMFTQIFSIVTTSLSQQRGIAENDQRGRMLSVTVRGDLDHRTFRNVLPFRAKEDTTLPSANLALRAGYFEIDEGDPASDIDDVLQFTTSVNIQTKSTDTSPYLGNAINLSSVSATVGANQISFLINNLATLNYANYIAINSRVWANQNTATTSGYPNYNSGYVVTNVTSNWTSSTPGTTTVTVSTTVAQTGTVILFLSEYEPDFDDGIHGNQVGKSSFAEVCYFLRYGTLYRRVLLIREGRASGDAQPVSSTNVALLGNGTSENYAPANSTFWRDFDYSAFYYNGNLTTGLDKGVRFHNSTVSLSNGSKNELIFNFPTSAYLPFSLGTPHFRFGHSTTNGQPQGASTSAYLASGAGAGVPINIGRFNLQECSSNVFGYPGYLPNDPVSGAATTNPFDRQNISIDPISGLVPEYNTGTDRRGADILLTNVLTFDVKVWDPFNLDFVNLGDTTYPSGPFSANNVAVVDYPQFSSTRVVGGRLNTAYPSNGQYVFDTWHPSAFVTFGGNTYAEPPYMPYVNTKDTYGRSINVATPLTMIQIIINYRDISSNQIRQMTIRQSLVD